MCIVSNKLKDLLKLKNHFILFRRSEAGQTTHLNVLQTDLFLCTKGLPGKKRKN
jgi:hypothetical protein